MNLIISATHPESIDLFLSSATVSRIMFSAIKILLAFQICFRSWPPIVIVFRKNFKPFTAYLGCVGDSMPLVNVLNAGLTVEQKATLRKGITEANKEANPLLRKHETHLDRSRWLVTSVIRSSDRTLCCGRNSSKEETSRIWRGV